MAITDDTAALVAAQLTVSWAANGGLETSGMPLDSKIVGQYLKFRDAVRERPIGGGRREITGT